MLARIQVGLKPSLNDSFGEKVKKRIEVDLKLPVKAVRTIKIFTVDADINEEQLELAARGPLHDPVTQDYSLGSLAIETGMEFDWLVEVGFRPGVTDNEGRTAAQSLSLMIGRRLKSDEAVYTSVQYLISGDFTREHVEIIAKKMLANELIERFTIADREEFVKAGGIKPFAARVVGEDKARVAEIDLNISDEELMRISKEGVLALTLDEMKFIRDYLNRSEIISARKALGISENVTDVELEALAQTWSEHCKHKIFDGIIQYEDVPAKETSTITSLFDTYIKKPTQDIRQALGDNDWCLSVFKDNAGVIRFNDDWSLVFKVETHNSPSALDPYGGALTGIVGVNRDPFGTGMGAKLICNTNV
ncbi:MAG: phosphoribosylformylglycinamidine synthase subunit PurS, partial [Desulfobulbaceae bacterium]|nr:phosphoribosylformylglycinamidine synthase subunit PurS [Desulfobulbaceae bacterium]